MGWLEGIQSTAAVALPFVGQMLGQQQANAANRDNQERLLQWQGEMSNTAHQRQVKDLKAAGLNPILSANAGASTPSGGSAAPAQNVMEGLAATALEINRQRLDAKKQVAEIDLLKAQKTKTDTEAKVLRKDIPESEIKEGLWNKVKGIFDSNATPNPYLNKVPDRRDSLLGPRIDSIMKSGKSRKNPKPSQFDNTFMP